MSPTPTRQNSSISAKILISSNVRGVALVRFPVLAERATERTTPLRLPPDEAARRERDDAAKEWRRKAFQLGRRLKIQVVRAGDMDAPYLRRIDSMHQFANRVLAVAAHEQVGVGVQLFKAPRRVGDLRAPEDDPTTEAATAKGRK